MDAPSGSQAKRNWGKRGDAGSGLYFVGFIGAAVFYIQQAEGFWPSVLGFLKACVWPAMLVYRSLETLYR